MTLKNRMAYLEAAGVSARERLRADGSIASVERALNDNSSRNQDHGYLAELAPVP
jgi:hypothetical protein